MINDDDDHHHYHRHVEIVVNLTTTTTTKTKKMYTNNIHYEFLSINKSKHIVNRYNALFVFTISSKKRGGGKQQQKKIFGLLLLHQHSLIRSFIQYSTGEIICI